MNNLKWTKEKCKEVVIKYESMKDFRNVYPGACNAIYVNNWGNELCSHMIKKTKPNGYWTKEKCQNEALKYKTKSDFQKKSGSAYVASQKNKWVDEICLHMKILKYKKSYWTKSSCKEVALKCESKSEFKNKYCCAYKISKKNGWFDDICSHMKPFNDNNRCIYSYEFDDKSVYIGLTYDLNNRHHRHMNDSGSSVNKHIKNTNLFPLFKQLTDYMNIEDIKNQEFLYLMKYKNDGWNILNKAKTGSLGGITKIWTREKCEQVALKCKNKTEFWEKYSSAASSSTKNGWMDEICSHMKKKKT